MECIGNSRTWVLYLYPVVSGFYPVSSLMLSCSLYSVRMPFDDCLYLPTTVSHRCPRTKHNLSTHTLRHSAPFICTGKICIPQQASHTVPDYVSVESLITTFRLVNKDQAQFVVPVYRYHNYAATAHTTTAAGIQPYQLQNDTIALNFDLWDGSGVLVFGCVYSAHHDRPAIVFTV